MKLSPLTAVVLGAVLVFSAVDASAACSPVGGYYYNGYSFYQHIRKDGAHIDCWTYGPGVSTSGTTYCGFTAVTGIQFTGWSQQISQSFAIDSSTGAGNGGTYWELDYELDFDDPNNDGIWNKVTAEVWVTDGGGSTLVASHQFTGSDGDVTCHSRLLTFTGNYEGKTMQVIIKSSRGYSNVVQRVRDINLWQRNP